MPKVSRRCSRCGTVYVSAFKPPKPWRCPTCYLMRKNGIGPGDSRLPSRIILRVKT